MRQSGRGADRGRTPQNCQYNGGGGDISVTTSTSKGSCFRMHENTKSYMLLEISHVLFSERFTNMAA